MKYLFDLTSLSKQNTGIESVAENACWNFLKYCKKDDVVLLFNHYVPKRYEVYDNNENVHIILLKSRSWKKLRFFDLPKYINNSKADVNIFLAFPCPYFANHKNSITLIHDLTAFKFPKTQTFLQNLIWKAEIRKCIKKDKHILTVSDTVKYEIAELFSRNDSKRIYPGVKTFRPSSEFDFEKFNIKKNNYVLSVSTQEPRKNLSLLIDAFKIINQNSFPDLKLVVVGKSGWKEKSKNISSNIIFTEYVDDCELASLYDNCKLFVSTSMYEGFGLPVIEALYFKCRVLCSDINIYREITKNYNVDFFKNGSLSDLIYKLKSCLKTENIRQSCDSSLLNKYSWKTFAENLYKYLTVDKNRLLYICSGLLNNNTGSNARQFQCIEWCNENFETDIFQIKYRNPIITNLKSLARNLRDNTCLIKKHDINDLLNILNSGRYDNVYLDNSLYGKLPKILKNRFPSINVFNHFHNCEYDFWKDYFSFNNITWKNIYSKLSLRMIQKSEFFATKFTDKQIYISEKDKNVIFNKYNINNAKSIVVSPKLKDEFHPNEYSYINDAYVLFFGSDFYANIDAANFLINNVAPKIKIKVVICGENLNKKLNIKSGNVEIIADGEKLNNLLFSASAVVFPIFLGSGAKIKTCHALMFGKYIIGTPDSFMGYSTSNVDINVCKNQEEFINAINSLDAEKRYYEKNRKLFLRNYCINTDYKN